MVDSDHPYSKLLTEEPEKQQEKPSDQEEPEKEMQIVKLKRQISRRVRKYLTYNSNVN